MTVTSQNIIRVVLADDSALMRKKIREILAAAPGIDVVGCARNGREAVDLVRRHQPDVVTLDINMPVMDGVTALQVIMEESPRPVVMLSSLTQEGALTTYECLELGAVDVVGKLSGTISVDIERQASEIVEKVRAAACARIGRGRRGNSQPRGATGGASAAAALRSEPGAGSDDPADRLVAIGTSTGGPKTLLEIVPLLPPDLPAAVVIVQHMPETFTASLAHSLNNASQLPVKEADASEVFLAGRCYVARGGRHLVFNRRRTASGAMARYLSQPADALHIPSVDVMMRSAAEVFGRKTVGVLLTGMGCDGADGMVQIHQAGGPTIAEDESTSVVFGMPAQAIARGAARFVLPCHEIAARINALVRSL